MERKGKVREKEMPTNPIVVDAHRYYTFTERDHKQSPPEIIARVGGELGELKGKEGNLVAREKHRSSSGNGAA